MSEIKPVYQVKTFNNLFEECSKEFYDLQLQNEHDWIQTRILYPAAAYEALRKENEALIQKLETAAFNHFAAQERVEALHKQVDDIAKGIQKHFELSDSDLVILMSNFENGDSK